MSVCVLHCGTVFERDFITCLFFSNVAVTVRLKWDSRCCLVLLLAGERKHGVVGAPGKAAKVVTSPSQPCDLQQVPVFPLPKNGCASRCEDESAAIRVKRLV